MQALPSRYGDYEVHWPDGLALDTAERRVYWLEAVGEGRGLYSTDYSGADFRAILFQSSHIAHQFLLVVSGSWYIWSEWSSGKGIYATSKCSNETIQVSYGRHTCMLHAEA